MQNNERMILWGVLALVTIGVLIDAAGLVMEHRALQPSPANNCTDIRPRSLPCEAIPVRFVHESPACAQRLLDAMNLTNVHVADVNQLGRTGMSDRTDSDRRSAAIDQGDVR